MKEVHGIEPAAGGVVMAVGPAAGAGGLPPKKDQFYGHSQGLWRSEDQVIKEVRALTGLGLKEAKRSGGRSSQTHQGKCRQGRSRSGPKTVGSCRGNRRDSVISAGIRLGSAEKGLEAEAGGFRSGQFSENTSRQISAGERFFHRSNFLRAK